MARFKMKVENPKYGTRNREFVRLRDAQVAASYTLYDNGVADKKTAQTVAAGLKLDTPGGYGGYTFTITKQP